MQSALYEASDLFGAMAAAKGPSRSHLMVWMDLACCLNHALCRPGSSSAVTDARGKLSAMSAWQVGDCLPLASLVMKHSEVALLAGQRPHRPSLCCGPSLCC